MKYIELFAGIGGFRSALDAVGGECVFASEIDGFATQSYKALYNGAPELHGDITQIAAEDIPDHDLLAAGFPCQDFSIAGLGAGFEGSRGILFFQIARIAAVKKPRLMLLENVKGLLSHGQGRTFEKICITLNELGYAIDFKVLNSKYYGVPQNRERVFIICDREAENEKWLIEGKDLETRTKRRIQALELHTFNFDWPSVGEVTSRLRDILEPEVAEKYYLSEEKTSRLISGLSNGYTATSDSEGCILVGRVDIKGHDQNKRVYSPEGICPTPSGLGIGGNSEPKVMVATSKDTHGNTQIHSVEPYTDIQKTHSASTTVKYDETGTLQAARLDKVPHVVTPEPKIEVRPVLTPDRTEKRQNGRRFKNDGEESFTLTAQDKHGIAIGHYPRYRVRKLTPLECWRLQGFTDAQHAKVVATGLSDSQLYKQAGNAVTVNVIKAISAPLVIQFLW